MVEREGVVEGQLVELRDRQVLEEPPRGAAIVGFVKAAVAAVQDVVGVAGHERHRVVVAVLVLLGNAHERPAAVGRHHQARIHLVDPVEGVRVGEDLLVVVRAGAAADERIALLEALASVRRAVEAALVGCRLDRGVDDPRVDGRHREANLPDVARGQADGELAPRLAGVLALVDGRLRAAAHEGGDGAPALVGGRVQDVGVRRVHLGGGDTRVLRNGERHRPGLAAVGRLVEASVPSRRPERSLGRDEHDRRVSRVDQDAGDVLGVLQPHVRPRLAAVQALVDAVAVADVAPAHVLAGADPDGFGIRRVERDAPDRVRRLIVEDRRPGGARVPGLPHAARSNRDVPGGPSLRVNRNVADAARHDGGADVAQREAREKLGRDERGWRGRLHRRPGGLGGGRALRRLGLRGLGGLRRPRSLLRLRRGVNPSGCQDDRQRGGRCSESHAHCLLQPRHRGVMYPETRGFIGTPMLPGRARGCSLHRWAKSPTCRCQDRSNGGWSPWVIRG